MANMDPLHEVSKRYPDGWRLCFQYCRWVYGDDRPDEYGYRFIYRDPQGKLRPQRGGARIEDLKTAEELMAEARSEGWGDFGPKE